MQILFPDPLMARLRAVAAVEDRPVSEVVRRAVERWLDQSPGAGVPRPPVRTFPTFHGGSVLVSATEMRTVLEADRPLV